MSKARFITPPDRVAKDAKRIMVKMLKTVKGADDQVHIKTYHENKEYELSELLANIFVKEGNADFTGLFSGKKKEKLMHENKALTQHDYQNKSA